MIRLRSKTGKVHIGLGETEHEGALCNSGLGDRSLDYTYYAVHTLTKTNKGVTCKRCLKLIKKYNPNREESLMAAESFMPERNEYFKVQVTFPEFSTKVTEPFKTEEEKNAYIKGIKNARCWANFDAIIRINGELV